MKYLGKLAGNTPALSAMLLTSAENTTSPYTVQIPGAKFRAYGENNNSLTINRELTALQANIEEIAGVLDGPALASTVIVATISDAALGRYGSEVLRGLDNTAATTDIDVDLSDLDGNVTAPVTWVYVGHTADTLHSLIRAHRYPQESPSLAAQAVAQNFGSWADVHSDGPRSALMSSATPTDVRLNTGGASVFPAISANRSPHRLLQTVTPITAAQPDLPPYLGIPQTEVIDSWDQDGCILVTNSWHYWYMQAGCFVDVTGSTYNDGLWRIAGIASSAGGFSKAIFTRGGLHKVTVTNGALFAAGELVSWVGIPGDTAPATPVAESTYYGHILYISGNDLYIAERPCEQDFTVDGALVTGGGKTGKDNNSAGVFGTNYLGNVDLESGANNNGTIRVGTFIKDAAANESAVTAIIPASYPVVFNNASGGLVNMGTAAFMSPPGFVLNPVLRFAPGSIVAGNHLISCKTLTTVKNKLLSHGPAYQGFITPNKEDTIHGDMYDMLALRNFSQYLKTGDESATTRNGGAASEWPNAPFTAPASLLGANLWHLAIGTDLGVTLETDLNVTFPAGFIGEEIWFKRVTDAFGDSYTKAIIVSCSGGELIIRDVHMADWITEHWNALGSSTGKPITAANIVRYNGADTGHLVTAIRHAPYVLNHAGTPVYQFPGLYGAYLSAFNASKGGRKPNGNILLEDGYPLYIHVQDTYVHKVLDIRGETGFSAVLIEYERQDGDHAGIVAINDGTGAPALAFRDTNIVVPVPVGDPTDNTLPGSYASILAALTGLHQLDVWEAATDLISGDDMLQLNAANVIAPLTRTLIYPGSGWKSTHAGVEPKRFFFNPDTASLFAGQFTGTQVDVHGDGNAVFGFNNRPGNFDYNIMTGVSCKLSHMVSSVHGVQAGTEDRATRVLAGNIPQINELDELYEKVGDDTSPIANIFDCFLYAATTPSSVSITWTSGAATITAVDNGAGVLTVLAVPKGSVVYSTGEVSLDMTGNVPDPATDINARYKVDSVDTEPGLCGSTDMHLTGVSAPGASVILKASAATHSINLADRAAYFFQCVIVGRPMDMGIAAAGPPEAKRDSSIFKFDVSVDMDIRSPVGVFSNVSITAYEANGGVAGGLAVNKASGATFLSWNLAGEGDVKASVTVNAPTASRPTALTGAVGYIDIAVGDLAAVATDAGTFSWSCSVKGTYMRTQKQRYPGEPI